MEKNVKKGSPIERILSRRVGAGVAATALAVGLVVTTGMAGAEPPERPKDLSSLIEAKLGDRPESSVEKPEAESATIDDGVGAAGRMALITLAAAAMVFGLALVAKRNRERRMGEDLGSHLSVRESVWVGRGQKIVLLGFENHKVLVGVTGGSIQNLGVFGNDGETVVPPNPIEREAAQRAPSSQKRGPEFSDFVRGELAGAINGSTAHGNDPRQKMLSELNSL